MTIQKITTSQGRKVYFGTSTDIEEINKLRSEVTHLERVKAVGRLAASVAHDFNNMLSPILGHAELVQLTEALSPDGEESIHQIMVAAKRSRELVSQLLSLGRKQIFQPRPNDLCEMAREAEGLLSRVLRENIEFSIRLMDSPCFVRVDPSHMQNIILNLSTNAQDAMPKGGKLVITVGKKELPVDEEAFDGATRWYGEISISDNGEGIPPEIREQMFEPFFSTKGDLGTGLGLATVHSSVKQHEGVVKVYSEPGVGTTIRIFLPSSDPPDARQRQDADHGAELRDLSILVAEDNPLVRHVVETILKKHRCRVESFSSPSQAISFLENNPRDYDLLITDMVLPDSNGLSFSEQMQTRQPGIKTLLMSGYPLDLISENGEIHTSHRLIQKPFSSRELIHAIYEVMDK